MIHFGLTQPTAEWLLGKPGVLDKLHDALKDPFQRQQLLNVEFVEGPIRLTLSSEGDLVLLWHSDYLSGTGDEDWGFIRLTDDGSGILERDDISREVMDRCIYVVNQRLQGLFLEGALIHRAHANGGHTCLAGRGSDARQVSIGYSERDVAVGANSVHSVICIGPAWDLGQLAFQAGEAGQLLTDLVVKAGQYISPRRKRQVAPPSLLQQLRNVLTGYFETTAEREYEEVSVETGKHVIADRDSHRTAGYTLAEWLAGTSTLSPVQRRLLESDALERHPIRIVGPGGSGKTLLMQLLALRRLQIAQQQGRPIRLLYLVHNAKMVEMVKHRFSILQGMAHDLTSSERVLKVQTLAEYGRHELTLEDTQIIDPDAHEAKEFQFAQIHDALLESMAANSGWVDDGPLFREIRANEALRPIMVSLLMSEISTAIKGHGLVADEKRYVQSERRLSRLHGVLSINERRLVFDVFRRYHSVIFEAYRVLDSDDVALSLLGRLRSPIWELKRRDLGFDYVFVDEAQLFNENERRILPLLTKSTIPHVPIVLALDEAQEFYGQSVAGLAALGIENVASESLSSIHRSTRAIVKLAFFVIQRSTDLFGPDFPDFTGIAEHMEEDSHPLAATPSVELMPEAPEKFGRFLAKRIGALRKQNLRRIAVICYADQYWPILLSELRKTTLPLRVLSTRGERIQGGEPVVALSRPAQIGGQEFDAVILVGLEEGVVPPRVIDNDALAGAVEQQALREIYLGVTRARYQLKCFISSDSLLTPVLAEAERAGLLERVVAQDQ